MVKRVPKKGREFIGIEISEIDLKIIRQIAADDDRSIGSVFRLIVADWVTRDPRATILKSALMTEEATNDSPKQVITENE